VCKSKSLTQGGKESSAGEMKEEGAFTYRQKETFRKGG